jgi:potassium efflux system protein
MGSDAISSPRMPTPPRRREESSIKPFRIALTLSLTAGIASALLFLSVLPVSAAGKSQPPEVRQPAPAAAESATSPKPAAAPSAVQPVPAVIAVEDIPLEADRLMNALRSLEERIALTGTTRDIEARLPVMAQRIADAQLETKDQLGAASSMTVLTNLADLWLGIQGDLKVWADRLRARAAEIGTILDQLSGMADTWTRTREEARRTKAPPALLKRTEEALAAIAKTQGLASARRSALLTAQVKIGEQLALVEVASTQVARVMSADLSTVLQRDGVPVWEAWREGPSLVDMSARIRQSAAPQLDLVGRFFIGRPRETAAHVGFLVVFVLFALVARRRVRQLEADGSPDPMLRVLELPISTALILTLEISDFLYVRPPMVATNLIGLILLVPVVRILSKITAPAPTAAFWLTAAIFTLNRVRDLALLSAPVAEQFVVLFIAVSALASLVWLWRRDALIAGRFRLPQPLAWLAMVTLAVSIGAASFGYMRLARLLGGGVLRGAYLALGLYAGAVVAVALFAYLLHVWPLARLRMVDRHRLLFERRAAVVIAWGAAFLWLREELHWFALLDDAERLGRAVLEYRVARGFVSLSPGDVLAFIATVWLAFLVSRFVRFMLEEDVFPRLPMGRGLPYAVSSLLHYLILLLGFLAAIGAMGVDLNRVTLLTGAFGVGVGFGLQTIVNNFVSGIILLLERPIQVGDAIQMTDLDGEVRRIGIRSTTVHTWRGAEVIVPNATLISGNLTNWTLSDRTRRFELPVGVAYGTDPQRVIDLLREAAASVAGVLKNPAPVVLFQSFGDSSLNFEVRAWTARFEEWAAVHSQVAVAVNAALKAAGIEIPFPQRDVTLRYPSPEEK